jgi:sulfate permease
VPSHVTSGLLIVSSVFFALNMGGAGFSPSFSAALGAKLIDRKWALALFAVCVGIGALAVGGNVAETLGTGFVPASTIDRQTALVLIVAATGALFIANLAKIPESTSWVTVFALASLGLMRSNLNSDTIIYKLLPAWISIPPLAFLTTYALTRRLYPLRGWNYRLYEHLTKHEWKLRALVLASSCYLAVAVGANNVANVVGPLATAGVFDVRTGMLLFTPVFALGGFVFFRATTTIGSDVVPLGLYSAVIINVVVGSMVLIVSWIGIPQSLVHAQVLSVFAIALAKEGSHELLRHRVIRRIALFWIVSPVLAAALVALQLLLIR